MAVWLVEADFGSGYIDITPSVRPGSLRRRMNTHSSMTAVTNSASFVLAGSSTLVANFVRGTSNIAVRVAKDGVRWFQGLAQRTAEVSVASRLGDLSVTVYSSMTRLDRKMQSDYRRVNATLGAIVQELLTAAGVSYSTLTLPQVIAGVSFAAKTVTYREAIDQLLGSFGYVLTFNASDAASVTDLFPANPTSSKAYTTGFTGNVLGELTLSAKQKRYGGVKATFYRQVTKANAIIFSDATDAGALAKCNIDLTKFNGVYPPRSGNETVYCEYACKNEAGEKQEIVVAQTVTLDADYTGGVTLTTFVDNVTKAAVRFDGTGIINRLDIRAATLIVRGAKVVKEVLNSGAQEDTEELTLAFATTDADADRVVSGRAAYWRNSNVAYSFKTEEPVQPGDVINIVDANLSINMVCRVVAVEEFDEGPAMIVCEAAVPYALATVTTTGSAGEAPALPGGITAGIEAGATSYYRLLASITTLNLFVNGDIKPDLVQFQSVLVKGSSITPYAGRFRIYVDEALVHTSASAESVKNWIGQSILPGVNPYHDATSMAPVIAFYNNTALFTQEVTVELWDATNTVRFDRFPFLIVKDSSFTQQMIEQKVKAALPKYLGKFNQSFPDASAFNAGDWLLLYGTSNTPHVRGLYRATAAKAWERLADDIGANGFYFMTAMSDILDIVRAGTYGAQSVYGDITYIEDLAANNLLVTALTGVNAQFLGTVRGGTRYNADGTIANPAADGYVLLPDGTLLASNVELSGFIARDHEYVAKGVFRYDEFYPREF